MSVFGRENLIEKINKKLPKNGRRLISADLLNEILLDVLDSFFNKVDDNTDNVLSNLQNSYANGSQIVTDSPNGALKVKAGVSDELNLFEAKNLANAVTASITGEGLIRSRARIKERVTLTLTDPSYNDYDVGGFSDVALATSNTVTVITGFLSNSIIGRELTIYNNNTGSTNVIVIKNQTDTGSDILNRVQNFGDDIILTPGEQVTLRYRISNNLSRWGVVSVTRSTRKFIPETPAQITSNQNNFPTSGYDVLNLSADATRQITGFANGQRGKMLIVNNVGTVNLEIPNQSTLSTAANRCINGNAASTLTILPNDTAIYLYNSVISRWHLIAKSF